MFSHFISYIETHEFFQIELLLLLASLLLSLFFSNTLPYFVASAICVLATTTSLIFELFSDLSGKYAYLEATTTLTISLLLSGTFAYTLINRVSNVELRWHTITILAFWSYLALRAVWILEDTTRLSQPQVSSSSQDEVRKRTNK